METELKARYPGSHITLVAGRGGVFDVTCNGKLIYSKLGVKGQRFPNDGEIAGLIAQETG